ncbi:uncharacterized protein CcaverHIS019_0705840 [Cutaneotrichosporon cavernicola]|uniref:Protein YOP1 n=1 Tax=Cutaneotrichosporon cavernicola TaxID=279322 RepID=A0AA48LAI7_9TREE|nr:uncharacterized protein CcaverHIS019_0705840 [Cutaneotrichosporon cavernicola]BEI95003.1 hypothetical protein CcaverHIS019_0705840 [Cutaneotrichosporon cavernicola]BEJ02777.1 hypothetical protein CcaverHIS631_0705720 [Cutaneotrichosporon cavernicola]BEJ10530.1 hypothetical protein CcaverHIS641_0705650 [Cutaneotrichosporon cavernicola]
MSTTTPAPTKQTPLQRARAAGANHAARATAHLNVAKSHIDNIKSHPQTQRAVVAANEQVERLRAVLGRSESVVAAEKATGIERVRLVVGAVVAFVLLVPLNLFDMAASTTRALTLIFPAYKAIVALERASNTDNLLAYFIILGYFQVLESLLLPILVSQIPRYYTVKVAFMFYLAHPRLNGATKIYNLLFSRKLVTPPLSPRATSPNGADPLTPMSPTRAAGVPIPLSPTSPSQREDVFTSPLPGFTRIPRSVDGRQ